MAADPGTGIITDEKQTGAAGVGNSDAAVAVEFVAAEAAGGDDTASSAGGHDDDDADAGGGQLTWYADSAYGTGDLRAAIAGAGHQAVIKPWPLLPAVKGGFTADDFTVDPAARTVTCPAASPGTSPPRTPSSAGPPAATARCASGAPPPGTAAPCTCTNTTACCAPHARTGPQAPRCARTT